MKVIDLLAQLLEDNIEVNKVELWFNLKPTDWNLNDHLGCRVYAHQVCKNGKLRIHI